MPRRIPFLRPGSWSGPEKRTEAKAERDAFYSSARWMRLRAVFLRANPLCAYCLAKGIESPADTAHHKIDRLVAPDLALDWDNLEANCKACHTTHHKSRPDSSGQ